MEPGNVGFVGGSGFRILVFSVVSGSINLGIIRGFWKWRFLNVQRLGQLRPLMSLLRGLAIVK